MSDYFDEQALMDHVDDDMEFLAEIIAMLEEDGPALLEEIRLAAQSDNVADVVQPAHTLKGIFGNFCAARAETAAFELEKIGRERRLNDLRAAAEKLQLETQHLIESLKRFLRERNA